MNESSNAELQELAESVFADARGAGTGFDAALWKTLEDTGLARLTLPGDAGGSEATTESTSSGVAVTT